LQTADDVVDGFEVANRFDLAGQRAEAGHASPRLALACLHCPSR
jgi:hypothetical protein